jgi:para-nitrobenzyl esterase
MRPIEKLCISICLAVTGGSLLPDGAKAAAPIVQTSQGPVQGLELTDGAGAFKGIPYAAPPVGANRWRSPQPPSPWRQTRAATHYGSACMQPAQGWNDSLIPSMSEDCLYLNVWTPALKKTARLPVMVWIHGGAFVGGAGTDAVFAGDELIKKGVVLVTINYRLGIFGFFAHPQLTTESAHHTSGNYALEDQLAALDWVHANISAFGGDPKNITLFGQSAGGMSVVSLLTSPLAQHSFQRAIIESGAILGGPPASNLQSAEAVGRDFAGEHDIASLRQLSAEELLKQFSAFAATHRQARLGPIVDGYVMAMDPNAAFREHRESSLPLMIGNNAREGFGRLGESDLNATIKAFYGTQADDALPLYGIGGAAPSPSDPVLGSAPAQWLTDTSFRCSAVVTAKLHAAQGSPVYEYHFEQSLPGRDSDGAAHSYELPYVFGNLLPEGALAGKFTDADHALSTTMVSYWTNFAKRSDPNGPNLPPWPRFDKSGQSYLRLSTALPRDAQAASGLRQAQCQLFENKLNQNATH